MRAPIFRLWLWRFAMIASAITALFFVITAVSPFTPVGEPVFETLIARERWWTGLGVGYVHLLGVALWLLTAITAGTWGRGLKALAAGALLLACLFALAAENSSMIQDGGLRDPIAVATHKLMVSRAITLSLAITSLAFGWWARPKG